MVPENAQAAGAQGAPVQHMQGMVPPGTPYGAGTGIRPSRSAFALVMDFLWRLVLLALVVCIIAVLAYVCLEYMALQSRYLLLKGNYTALKSSAESEKQVLRLQLTQNHSDDLNNVKRKAHARLAQAIYCYDMMGSLGYMLVMGSKPANPSDAEDGDNNGKGREGTVMDKFVNFVSTMGGSWSQSGGGGATEKLDSDQLDACKKIIGTFKYEMQQEGDFLVQFDPSDEIQKLLKKKKEKEEAAAGGKATDDGKKGEDASKDEALRIAQVPADTPQGQTSEKGGNAGKAKKKKRKKKKKKGAGDDRGTEPPTLAPTASAEL